MLGDNPFFGVDHLSHERGRQRFSKNKSFDNTVEVIKCCYEMGVKDMMVSTRPNLSELFEALNNRTNLLEQIAFHPLLPYAQQYVLKASQKGIVNTLKEILSSAGIRKDLKLLVKGGFSFLKKDIEELFKIFIDIELLQLKNIKLKTVFLHPVLTDLALALNMKEIFITFNNHLHDNYDVNAGFCTKNFPSLATKLKDWNLFASTIMTSFNKCGYIMNPSKIECEEFLDHYDGRVVAMNIFAGGYLTLKESYDYISSLPKLRDVIIGVSSIDKAKQTFALFKNQ